MNKKMMMKKTMMTQIIKRMKTMKTRKVKKKITKLKTMKLMKNKTNAYTVLKSNKPNIEVRLIVVSIQPA